MTDVGIRVLTAPAATRPAAVAVATACGGNVRGTNVVEGVPAETVAGGVVAAATGVGGGDTGGGVGPEEGGGVAAIATASTWRVGTNEEGCGYATASAIIR